MDYHRRSRSGCLTCRSSRIKCDEAHPDCKKCGERGLKCQGYAKVFTWVEKTPPRPRLTRTTRPSPKWNQSRSTSLTPSQRAPSSSMIRSCQSEYANPLSRGLVNVGQPAFIHNNDMLLFQYWVGSILELSLPCPDRYWEFLDSLMSMVTEPDSLLLPTILASASIHMGVAGLVPETEVLSRKQVAIKAVIRAIGKSSTLATTQREGGYSPSNILKSLNIALSASMHLIGAEIIQGSGMDSLFPLFQGAAFIVEKRWAVTQLNGHRDDFHTLTSIKLLAWHDRLTCVPFPKQPLLDKKYWIHEATHDAQSKEPDTVFGFSAAIAALMGECGTAVEKLYRDKFDMESFRNSRCALIDSLSEAVSELPPRYQLVEAPSTTTQISSIQYFKMYNACVFAAIAHAVACQIYLFRATEDIESSLICSRLALELEELIKQVPCSSAAMTIMLWPLWVIGCESISKVSRREFVVERLLEMFSRYKFQHIKTCIDTLRNEIWSLVPDVQEPSRSSGIGFRMESPPSWVRVCFDRQIRPVLV